MGIRSRIFGTLLVGAFAAATTLVGGVAHAGTVTGPVQPRASVFVLIHNIANDQCLQPEGGSTQEFAPIVQAHCVGGTVQGWEFQQISGTRYHFLSQQSGYCMDAFGSVFNGSRVLQVSCARVSNEEWNTGRALPIPAGQPGDVSLQSRAGNKDTGFCLDEPAQSPAIGLRMQLWGCNGTFAQRWFVG
jgi:hypothetical protein